MKNIGVISYNIYGNFTNYGSALQSWAMHQAMKEVPGYNPILVDYCPDILKDKDPLNPFKNMWDKDEESRKMCELSLPAIRENYYKFDQFYTDRFERTNKKYTSQNFEEVVSDEKLTGFLCGSDTIFCMDEFGFDDGYYANYECMKNKSVAYAASFGEPTLSDDNCQQIRERINNFKALGIRENHMIPFIKSNSEVTTKKVVDPTLLFDSKKYEDIVEPKRLVEDKYLLYYSRRYSPVMEEYVEKLAQKNNWKIVEISLRATNVDKGHIMFYEAGVEEFLSLVKHSEFVVTNSFHGMIFAVQFKRPFVIFSREQCSIKIDELLELFGLQGRKMITGNEVINAEIDYELVHKKIKLKREESWQFLKEELLML